MVHGIESENELQIDLVRLGNEAIDSVIFCDEFFESVSQYYGLITNAEMKPNQKGHCQNHVRKRIYCILIRLGVQYIYNSLAPSCRAR